MGCTGVLYATANMKKLLTLVDHHFRYQHKSDVELMNRTIEDHELTINCTHCDLKFTEERFMEYHKQLEHFKNLGSRVQTTHCTLCDVEFRDNYNYHIHKNQIHKKEYDLFKMKAETLEFKFKCILCQKHFPASSSLTFHLETSHDIIKELEIDGTKCDLCMMTFNGDYLLKHILKIHLLELDIFKRKVIVFDQEFSCSICEKKYAADTSLKYHMKVDHMKERRLKGGKGWGLYEKCKLCYINTSLKSNHKMHIHKDELDLFEIDLKRSDLKHNCESCNLKFISITSLNCHKLKVHKEYTRKKERIYKSFKKNCRINDNTTEVPQ